MENLIKEIAKNCQWAKTVNENYKAECEERIYKLEQNHLPKGSGIDAGCKIDVEKSSEKKVVINFGYHHMDEHGYYDGWTEHKLIVTPNLTYDFDLRITGPNRNFIKDYLYEMFDHILKQPAEL